MKLLFSALIMVALAPLAVHSSCDDDKAHRDQASVEAKAGKDQALVKVAGMSCGSCVKKLEGKVAKINKSKGVVINVAKNLVTIDYSKSKLTKKDLAKLKKQVEAAVKEANFTIKES